MAKQSAVPLATAPTASNGGLTVTAHVGDRSVLLAFDIDPAKTKGLAGFAVQVTPENGKPYFLVNRLGFKTNVTKTNGLNDGPPSAPSAAKYVSTADAPIQMFHWVHFPPEGTGKSTYVVTARYFDGTKGALKDGGKVSLDVVIDDHELADLAVGMTRGYVSSQAFIDKFASFDSKGVAQLWPDPKTIDFPTAKYEKVYEYLGAHGRKMVFDFLAAVQAKKADLDILAYDFNEPDVIRAILAIKKAGATVRFYLDDSVSHTGTALESVAADLMTQNGVPVKRGHFTRFAHDKVFIMKEGGKATQVLTGSANFSLRGLYVQANSVLVINDPAVAGLYEQVFTQTWNAAAQFKDSPLAAKWFDQTLDGSPLRISFAPHKDAFPLTDASNAINAADSSVLFAVMTASGGGDVIKTLDEIGEKQAVLSLGTIESSGQLTTFKGEAANSDIVGFAYLRAHTPPPFNEEVDAGMGQHIHHKFVVCDFNGTNPVVFCGSSNLSGGGETNNGDNLLAIYDRRVATAYAVEAVRLFDHYRFRSRQAKSTTSNPLTLATDDSWTKPFYDQTDIRFRERQVMVQTKVVQSHILASGPTISVKAKGATTPAAAKKPATTKKPAGVHAGRASAAAPKRAR